MILQTRYRFLSLVMELSLIIEALYQFKKKQKLFQKLNLFFFKIKTAKLFKSRGGQWATEKWFQICNKSNANLVIFN